MMDLQQAAEDFHKQHPQYDLCALVKRCQKLLAGYDPQDELEVRLSRHLESRGLLTP